MGYYIDKALPTPASDPKNMTAMITPTMAKTIAPMAIQKVIFVHRAAFEDASLACEKSP